MSDFRSDWRDAMAGVLDNGAAVSFTPAPGSPGPVFSGYAMQVDGDPRLYDALGLTESHIVTLFFVPGTYGVLPSLLPMSVIWAGETFLVKKVPQQIAPDGNCIAAHVVVAR